MPLYLVSRTDEVDWNEHNDVVVRALTKARALKLVCEGATQSDGTVAHMHGYEPDGSNATAKRVWALGREQVICEEFVYG